MQLHLVTSREPFFSGREVRRRILNELLEGEGLFVRNNFISWNAFLGPGTTCVCKFHVESVSLKLEMSKYTLLVCRLKCFLESLGFHLSRLGERRPEDEDSILRILS
jgi:hypothetical protein